MTPEQQEQRKLTQKIWVENNRDRVNAYQKKYQKEYYKRPEVKKRLQEYGHEYNRRPAVKARMKIHNRQQYEKQRERFVSIWGEVNLSKPRVNKNKEVFRY